jgi:hypothetical protein
MGYSDASRRRMEPGAGERNPSTGGLIDRKTNQGILRLERSSQAALMRERVVLGVPVEEFVAV